MTVKFKIGFTIDGETLFGLMSKFLPIDNLSVEEMVERQPRIPIEAIAHAVKHITKPKRTAKRASPGPNLEKGLNGIIMAALSSGPQNAKDLLPKAVAAGFSPNSVTSRLEELRKFGTIERVGDGTWRKK
jgi:hypothetical protein